MRRCLLIAGLMAMTTVATGCLIIDVEKVHTYRPPAAEPVEATIREIDAVGRLEFDHDRQSGFKRIARREGLGDAAQVHLVEVVFERLDFEHAQVDVLLALVANPGFGAVGEAALLERLDRLDFEHNKRRILDAVGERKT